MQPPPFDAQLLGLVEDAGLNASAPAQQRWLDGWLLRLSPGKAKRARCVNALAAGRMPLDDKLARCEQAFEQAGLPFIVRITPMTVPPELDVQLEQRGLRRFDDTRVMVLADIPVKRFERLPPGVTLHTVALEAFAQRIGGLRGSSLAQRQAHGQRLINSPVGFHAFEMQVSGEVVCCGQFALEADLAGLYDVFTAPAARGKGYARLLCAQLLSTARERGARHGYLQVEADNAAARAVYRQLRFADAYAYHYRTTHPTAA